MKNSVHLSIAGSSFHQRFLSRLMLALLVLFTFSQCKKQDDDLTMDDTPNYMAGPKVYHDRMKTEFGSFLAKAISKEEGMRSLLKAEALKRFNYDYEVLYYMIKDQPVRDGKTFRDLLLEYSGNKTLLKEIEKEVPLLTILIPELPQNSFSAANWDTKAQLPVVALRVWSDKGVPMLAPNGESFYLPFDRIPGFAVVVVKDNERLTISRVADELTFQAPNSNFYFRFTDKNFNNLKGQSNSHAAARVTVTLDQKIINARNIMNPVGGWHRDHIYYGLTPGNDKGPFSLDYKEKLTSFRFNTGMPAYEKISEQTGDPKIYGSYSSSSSTPPIAGAAWTDGSFEFAVNALVNSKATGLPAVNPSFFAEGEELFDIEYELLFYKKCNWYQGCFGSDTYTFGVKNVTPKLFSPLSQKVELINWDLEKFAPTMAISITEVDLNQTVTTREKSSTEFAANFGLDSESSGGTPIMKKLGLKFGASAKKLFESERTVVTTLESDRLGENALIEFGDKVIINEIKYPVFNRSYETREYSTGIISFSIEPMRVQ